MSDVKRYSIGALGIIETEDGRWVEHSAYIAMKQRIKILSETILIVNGQCETQQRENERIVALVAAQDQRIKELTKALEFAAKDCHLTVMRHTPEETLIEAWMDRAKAEGRA